MNQPIPLLAALAEHTQNAAAHPAKATEERLRAFLEGSLDPYAWLAAG